MIVSLYYTEFTVKRPLKLTVLIRVYKQLLIFWIDFSGRTTPEEPILNRRWQDMTETKDTIIGDCIDWS